MPVFLCYANCWYQKYIKKRVQWIYITCSLHIRKKAKPNRPKLVILGDPYTRLLYQKLSSDSKGMALLKQPNWSWSSLPILVDGRYFHHVARAFGHRERLAVQPTSGPASAASSSFVATPKPSRSSLSTKYLSCLALHSLLTEECCVRISTFPKAFTVSAPAIHHDVLLVNIDEIDQLVSVGKPDLIIVISQDQTAASSSWSAAHLLGKFLELF